MKTSTRLVTAGVSAAAVLSTYMVHAGAEQAPIGRGGTPQEQAAARAAQDNVPRHPLLFKEEWRQPPYSGELSEENRRLTQAAVTNPSLEVRLYGTAARDVGVYSHEGRIDLWTGVASSPVAITLRDRNNLIDLTGLSRLRVMARTANLHVLHPVLKLSDGTLIAGSQTIDTNGAFLVAEVAFNNARWFKVDPEKVTVGAEVKTPDLGSVDEIGFVDLMPGGGHGASGWSNISTFELFAKSTPRTRGAR